MPAPDVWETITAIGTALMAVATFCVVRQGYRQREQAQAEHRERLMPVCFFAPDSGVDIPHYRGHAITTFPLTEQGSAIGEVSLNRVIRNVGLGPALRPRIRFKFGEYWTEQRELSPLAAGESRGGQNQPVRVPVYLNNEFNHASFQLCTSGPWEIELAYEDVFGQLFVARHHLDSQKSWVTFDKGAATAGGDGVLARLMALVCG